MTPPEPLALGDARRLALRAQGLSGPRPAGGPAALLARLGAIQLDTISVLARSHRLVAHARLGPLPPSAIEGAFWAEPARTFEYWAHAACILPLERWPEFAFRRRAFRARGWRWHHLEQPERSCALVVARLTAEGPLSARDLGGARGSGAWWDWREEKIAVEWLLDTGVVTCTTRRGWQRVYDLAERAVPAALFHDDRSDAECLVALVENAGRALGVATEAELAAHHGLTVAQVRSVVAQSALTPVALEACRRRAYADPAALEAIGTPARSRTTLLSPFDSLVWDRARTARLFGFVHRLEAYVPAPRRVYGYYAMPVLAGGRLVGRVDPKRDGATLEARTVALEPNAPIRQVAGALVTAAGWVGCSDVRVGRVVPDSGRDALVGELRARGATG